MPLALGDAGRSLLSRSMTQRFYMTRRDRGKANKKRIGLNPGKLLDKEALLAGLGGRFSPGIDMTYICREPDLYRMDWQTSGTGPFRISPKPLVYEKAAGAPFLTLGWTPRRNQNQVEPGDISKFMAVLWHADYFSCGTHLRAPNLPMANTLYWPWPAQRPVAVAADQPTHKNRRFDQPDPSLESLARTSHIANLLARCEPAAQSLSACTAPSFLLDRAYGGHWLAVGDAASAYDPIASQGIFKALTGSLAGGQAIAAHLAGSSEALVAHQRSLTLRFDEYARQRAYFYDQEQRWRDAPFWAGRRNRKLAREFGAPREGSNSGREASARTA